MKTYKFIYILLFFSMSSSQIVSQNLFEYDYFLEGVKQYNEQDMFKAKSLLEEAIKMNPKNDAAHYFLGLSYFSLKDTTKAENHLISAKDIDPDNFWYHQRLAQFYSETGNMNKAINMYEVMAEDFSNTSSIYFDIIELYNSSGQYEKALSTLDKIESLKGKSELTGNARFELLNTLGKTNEAMDLLTELDKTYSSARTSFILGDYYKSQYKDSLAIMHYKKSISLDPNFSPSYFGLAEMYRFNNNYSLFFQNIGVFFKDPNMFSEIKTNYSREILFQPNFLQIYTPQLDALMDDLAIAHPSDSSALLLVGSYYIQTERLEKGKKAFLKYADSDYHNLNAHLEYVSLLYFLEEWQNLFTYLKKVRGIFPQEFSLIETTAIAYWQSGNIDNAINTYQELLDSLPKDHIMLAQTYSSLGDLYHEVGEKSKAYSNYEKALRINPEYLPVLNNYAYFLSLEKSRLKKALRMSEITVKAEPDNPTYLDTYGWLLYLNGDYEEAKVKFKHALIYGGNKDAVIVDHYGDVLYALKEYDLAFIYWEQADKLDPSLNIRQKIEEKREKK